MSIWNLPLAVDMPEVRTPTPAPLATFGLRGRSLRYGLTVLDSARATCADLANEPGCEEVCRCAACGGSTTDSVLGARGWHNLRRSRAKSVSFCPECYREFQPTRVAVAGRYAEALETCRDADAWLLSHPYCLESVAASAIAGLACTLARREWLEAEQEGGARKAS